MDEEEVFVKIEKSKDVKNKLYSVRAGMKIVSGLLKDIEDLSSKEKGLLKEWQEKVNLVSQDLAEAEERLPKGKL